MLSSSSLKSNNSKSSKTSKTPTTPSLTGSGIHPLIHSQAHRLFSTMDMESITLPKSKVALPSSMVKFLVTNMELHPKTIDYFRQYELDIVRKSSILEDQDQVDILHSFPSFHLQDERFIQFITAIYYLGMYFKDSGEAQQLADAQLGTPNPKTYL